MLVNETVKLINGEFRVNFTDRLSCGQPSGSYNGRKIIPSPHTHAVQVGQAWLVSEVLHFLAGSRQQSDPKGKREVHWGSLVYVWPIRRLD